MKRDHWVILLAFLGGIVIANLLRKELLTTYGILNDYFLNQYSSRAIDGNRLFCHILLERCKAAFIIFLLGRVLNGRIFGVLMEGLIAATFGFLVVVVIINLGVRGIAVSLGGMLPQWLFYLAAIFFYTACRREEGMGWGGSSIGDIPVQVVRRMLIVLLLFLGIVTESFVNPVLFGYVLKIF